MRKQTKKVPIPKLRGARHPWAKWFSERGVTLYKGDDFHCSLHGFAITVREAAKRRGIRVGVEIDEEGGSVYIWVKPSEEKK